MSSGSYKQAYVLCPFYLTDNGKDQISCEELIPGAQIQSHFAEKANYLHQIDHVCSRNYEKCVIFRALMEKYAE